MNPNDPNNPINPAQEPQPAAPPLTPQQPEPVAQSQPEAVPPQPVTVSPPQPASPFAVDPAVSTPPQQTPVSPPQPVDQPTVTAPVNPFAQQVDSSSTPPQQSPAYPEQPPIFGGQMPAPQNISPKQPVNKKLIKLIAILIGALAVIGVGIWALMTFVIGGIPLETHEGESYTVSVPRDYEEEALGADAVSFAKPQAEGAEAADDRYRSMVTISRLQFSTFEAFMSRDEVIKMYGSDSLNEAAIKESLEEGSELRNFSENTDQYQGFDARRVSFDVLKDGEKMGSMAMIAVFTEDSIYNILVSANADDPALARSASKIINSLKINE